MHIGDEEPDVRAAITMLRAISEHPSNFSFGAISLATRTAADMLTQQVPTTPIDPDSQCEGQLSILDSTGAP